MDSGQHVEQLVVHALDRVGRRAPRRRLAVVGGHVRQVLLDARDALLVVGHLEVADARLAAVHARAAELLLRDVLAHRRAHEVRAGERHRAAALDHRHEVGQPGDVGGARRARAHERRHLRDDAAHDDLLAEEVAAAGEERADGLLDPRAGAVEQPHEGQALGQRQLAQARDLDLAGHPHRAGHDREVVGGDRDQPAVDLAVAGDDAVGRRLLALQRAHRVVDARVEAQLGERAGVDEQVEALARGELVGRVLLGDLLLAAAELRLGAALVEVLDQRPEDRGRGVGAHGAGLSSSGAAACASASLSSGVEKQVISAPTIRARAATSASRSCSCVASRPPGAG